jgi:membrane protease YdiL (CAAX protease family)
VRWFLRLPPVAAGCVVEFSLLLGALLGAWLLGRPLLSEFAGHAVDVVLGVLATGPALGAFVLAQRSPWPPLARLRTLLDDLVAQWFSGCSWPELALLSALAGVGEEALFRGLVQGGLTDILGAATGVALASLLFGLCHSMTPTYAVAATLMGAYLGGLYLWTGNLVASALAHGLYDFVALLWLVRAKRARRGNRSSPEREGRED